MKIRSMPQPLVVGGLFVSCLVGLDLPGARASASPAPLPAVARPHPREKTLLKRQWGVEVVGMRLSAAGYMLEFRYRVLDAEKAKPLFVRQTKPLLVHERTGARFAVPTPAKTGALRNSDPPLPDRVYWMFFANPGQYVKAGERVAVVIGDFRAGGLVVE